MLVQFVAPLLHVRINPVPDNTSNSGVRIAVEIHRRSRHVFDEALESRDAHQHDGGSDRGSITGMARRSRVKPDESLRNRQRLLIAVDRVLKRGHQRKVPGCRIPCDLAWAARSVTTRPLLTAAKPKASRRT